ncbi:hypothetical protein LCGC14_2282410 [marine sediment metagenome]|uniref:Uncharacterized protein n=1 Tax=marine sediment metagenome TaxID=412755 RepID=A0A0F9F694_9ZZZZ
MDFLGRSKKPLNDKMGKIIDTKKFVEVIQKLNQFMSEQNLNKMESILIIEQYLGTLKIFEKLDSSQALRKTLEKHGDLIE